MAGKARGNFNELKKPITDDPIRAARYEEELNRAAAEHMLYTLAEIREELGVSQDDLAAHLGVTQSAVSQGLRNASTVAQIRRIIEALDEGGTLELIATVHGKKYELAV